MNAWCYHQGSFEPIPERLKRLAKQFLTKNTKDPLIKELIEKPSFFAKSAQNWAKTIQQGEGKLSLGPDVAMWGLG
jgi:hypothetical protein